LGANAPRSVLKTLSQYQLQAVCTAHEDTAKASATAFGRHPAQPWIVRRRLRPRRPAPQAHWCDRALVGHGPHGDAGPV